MKREEKRKEEEGRDGKRGFGERYVLSGGSWNPENIG